MKIKKNSYLCAVNENLFRTMKKLFVILFGIIIASCGNKDNTPEVVTQKFITAVNQEKFDEAKKYCDEQTAQMLDMLASMSKKIEKSTEEVKVDFKVVKVEKKGDDKAKVFYTVNNEKETSLDLKKIDGKWKVSIDKEQGKEGNTPTDVHDHSDSEHLHESIIEEVDSLSVEQE